MARRHRSLAFLSRPFSSIRFETNYLPVNKEQYDRAIEYVPELGWASSTRKAGLSIQPVDLVQYFIRSRTALLKETLDDSFEK